MRPTDKQIANMLDQGAPVVLQHPNGDPVAFAMWAMADEIRANMPTRARTSKAAYRGPAERLAEMEGDR